MDSSQRAILELVIVISGFALFWYATNFIAAAGAFLMLFANNIGHDSDV